MSCFEIICSSNSGAFMVTIKLNMLFFLIMLFKGNRLNVDILFMLNMIIVSDITI